MIEWTAPPTEALRKNIIATIILHWGYFLNWGDLPYDLHDWTQAGAYYSFLREALLTGQFPLHMDSELVTTPRYLARPDTPLSPDILLLRFLEPGPFTLIDTLLWYTVGFAGLLWAQNRLKLSPLAFTALFMLFNFNGHITAHLSVGHTMWVGYYLLPFWILLTLEAVETQPSGWRWAVRTALVLSVMFMVGAFHFALWCLLFTLILGLLVTENRYSDEITVLNAMIKELQEENAKLQANDRLTQDDLAEARQRVETYKSDAEKLDHVLELMAHNMLNGPESLRQFRVTVDTILVCIDEVFGKLRVLDREHVAREQASDLDKAQLQLLCEIVHSVADEPADPPTSVNVTSRVRDLIPEIRHCRAVPALGSPRADSQLVDEIVTAFNEEFTPTTNASSSKYVSCDRTNVVHRVRQLFRDREAILASVARQVQKTRDVQATLDALQQSVSQEESTLVRDLTTRLQQTLANMTDREREIARLNQELTQWKNSDQTARLNERLNGSPP